MSIEGPRSSTITCCPVYPVLDLLAAAGIVGTAACSAPGRRSCDRPSSGSCSRVSSGGDSSARCPTAPYSLPYFNPILGGTAGAARALLLGWGEGMGPSWQRIPHSAQPEGGNSVVMTSITSTTLLYLLPESVTVSSPVQEEA